LLAALDVLDLPRVLPPQPCSQSCAITYELWSSSARPNDFAQLLSSLHRVFAE